VSAVQYVPPVSPGSGAYLSASTISGSAGREKPLTTEDTGDTEEVANNTVNGKPNFLYRYPLQVMGTQILVETPLWGGISYAT